MQQIKSTPVRCIFPVKENDVLEVLGIDNTFNTIPIGVVCPTEQPIEITAMHVNNIFNFDISTGNITPTDIIHCFNANDYKVANRLYIYNDGEQIPISYIYINRGRRAIRRGQIPKYCVVGVTKDNQTIPLFSVPTSSVNDADMHLINFEVERLLSMENITILDESDVKFLFTLAVEYVDALRKGDFK